MLLLWFSLGLAVVPLYGKEIVFEKIEQLSGFNLYGGTLRVRKYNRTLAVLNGTLTIEMNLDNNIVVSTEMYHSSRGNQQFNHYPMKLPTRRLCEFMDEFYDDYGQAVAGLINMPKKGDCPITPREVYFLNMVFPTKALPPVIPMGLWKMFIINTLDNVEAARFELIFKAKSDIFS